HTGALQHAAGRRSRADRAGRALTVRLAVRLLLAVEVVALDRTGKAPPFGRPDHIDPVALCEDISRQTLAFFDIHLFGTELAQIAEIRQVQSVALQVPKLRLVEARRAVPFQR